MLFKGRGLGKDELQAGGAIGRLHKAPRYAIESFGSDTVYCSGGL